ncbi:Rv3235 family protein [Kitasatospora sp. NPDC050543]|uniref:Rv3235 family protein n=1 Tax=Kitasatospora sp. NPDC050543 TaxID=3364054 RepID=UPI0037A68C61
MLDAATAPHAGHPPLLARPHVGLAAQYAGTVPHPRRPAGPHPAHRSAPVRAPRHPRAACTAAAAAAGAGGELATRFAHRLVEVLTGLRPAGQLQRHTTLDGYGQLTALVRSGPLRRCTGSARARLGRVHDSAPSADVLEACVRVEFGPRHHMVAFRLERHRRTDLWQCSAIEAH